MRLLLTPVFLLSAMTIAPAQTLVPQPPPSAIPSSGSAVDALPDAPGEPPTQQTGVVAAAEASFKDTNDGAKTCNVFRAMKVIYVNPNSFDQVRKPCSELIYPYQRFLTTEMVIPMTWQQKGYLALHDLTDPANFGTIVGISAITIGADSHSAYGPGLKGFGKTVGVSLLVFNKLNSISPNASFTPKWSDKPLLKSYQKEKPPLGWPRTTDSLCPKCVPRSASRSSTASCPTRSCSTRRSARSRPRSSSATARS
jgi:hypothetical protein